MTPLETHQNVFVTGASGVLGRRVLGLLSDLRPTWKVVSVGVDLRDKDAVSSFCEGSLRPDMLFHLAAIVPTGRVDNDPLEAYEVNSIGAGRIFKAMLSRNPDLWGLYVSSSHVYASSESPLTENAPIGPGSAYGRTKLAGEFSVADVFDAERNSSLCVARVFSMYSSDQHKSFLYPNLLSQKKEQDNSGNRIGVQGWDNVRDFLHADVVANHLVGLSLCRAQGVFNVGSGIGTSVAAFARNVAGLELDLSDEFRAPVKSSLVADASKLRSSLNGT